MRTPRRNGWVTEARTAGRARIRVRDRTDNGHNNTPDMRNQGDRAFMSEVPVREPHPFTREIPHAFRVALDCSSVPRTVRPQSPHRHVRHADALRPPHHAGERRAAGPWPLRSRCSSRHHPSRSKSASAGGGRQPGNGTSEPTTPCSPSTARTRALVGPPALPHFRIPADRRKPFGKLQEISVKKLLTQSIRQGILDA